MNSTAASIPGPVSRLGATIQHTLIREGVTAAMVVEHCGQAREWSLNAVMVPSIWIGLCREELAGTSVRVASAVDFPWGAMSQPGRLAELEYIVDQGADEVDVAPPTGVLLSGDRARYHRELSEFVDNAGEVAVKVMLELPLLGDDDRRFAVEAAVASGARHVKNASSGSFGPARPDDIRFLRSRVPSHVGVKASGGIKSVPQALKLLEAGADLLGSSAGAQLAAGVNAGRSY